MVGTSSIGRRTVLQTLASCVAVLAGAGSASALQDESGGDATRQRISSDRTADAASGVSLRGVYEATVDRIVDGDHVVVLVEDGDSVVAQYVRDEDEFRSVSEGDRLLVFVLDGDLTVLCEL